MIFSIFWAQAVLLSPRPAVHPIAAAPVILHRAALEVRAIQARRTAVAAVRGVRLIPHRVIVQVLIRQALILRAAIAAQAHQCRAVVAHRPKAAAIQAVRIAALQAHMNPRLFRVSPLKERTITIPTMSGMEASGRTMKKN